MYEVSFAIAVSVENAQKNEHTQQSQEHVSKMLKKSLKRVILCAQTYSCYMLLCM